MQHIREIESLRDCNSLNAEILQEFLYYELYPLLLNFAVSESPRINIRVISTSIRLKITLFVMIKPVLCELCKKGLEYGLERTFKYEKRVILSRGCNSA